METIQFKSVLPDVFSKCPDIHSEVWRQELIFSKNTLTLVEAASGKGRVLYAPKFFVNYKTKAVTNF